MASEEYYLYTYKNGTLTYFLERLYWKNPKTNKTQQQRGNESYKIIKIVKQPQYGPDNKEGDIYKWNKKQDSFSTKVKITKEEAYAMML